MSDAYQLKEQSASLAQLVGYAKLSHMLERINTHEAKSKLSEIIRKVERGGDVVIARNGIPVARIIPWKSNKVRKPGVWEGKVSYISGNADDLVGSDPDILAMFEDSANNEL
jgi:prevent-host-death family protein